MATLNIEVEPLIRLRGIRASFGARQRAVSISRQSWRCGCPRSGEDRALLLKNMAYLTEGHRRRLRYGTRLRRSRNVLRRLLLRDCCNVTEPRRAVLQQKRGNWLRGGLDQGAG